MFDSVPTPCRRVCPSFAGAAGATRRPKAVIGGFVIIDVPSRQEALDWAARFAVACRCAQEVREIMFDPLV